MEKDGNANSSDLAMPLLQDLQSADERMIMELINKLRRSGLSNELRLPQLVVCGDQSSGKSSVLEAISGIPFPRKENLCTRFATEIVMRNDESSSISVKITPDESRPAGEQETLREFDESITDILSLESLFEKATRAMDLDSEAQNSIKAFTQDVLSIEISGPGLPQLTLVDLPGLIHSENKSQSESDVQLIHTLVDRYISNERTIILAVISAKNDYANQIILKHCRKVDPTGSRTLGIITKPDYLKTESARRYWIDLALNRDIYFERGWHMVKNRDDGDVHSTLEQRNASENLFFSSANYNELPRDMVGVEPLKSRLSQLLGSHLKKELPGLRDELEKKLLSTEQELSQLGVKKSTVREQRQYLMEISTTLHDLVRSAVHGQYDHPAFGPIDMTAEIHSSTNLQRLRAVVQHLNLAFAEEMRTRGHKYSICPVTEDSADKTENSQRDDVDGNSQRDAKEKQLCPKNLSRAEAVRWVLRVLTRSRGNELPGTFNPLIISHLFWEQSERWQAVALAHIDRVASTCEKFVKTMLKTVAPPDVAFRLFDLRVKGALKSALVASRGELEKVVEDKMRHPMTYNHYFTTTLQKLRQRKYGGDIRTLAENAKVQLHVVNNPPASGNTLRKYIDPEKLEQGVSKTIEQSMDNVSAEEALDCQIAYYKDELKFFVDVVTKQVIERHLVNPLPSEILSPMVVADLTDQEIRSVVAEPEHISQRRKVLEARKEMLESGQEIFQMAATGAY